MEIYTSIDIIKDEFNKEMLENRTDNYKVSPIDGIELLEALKKFNKYKLQPNGIVSMFIDKKEKIFILFSGEEVILKIKDVEYFFRYEEIIEVDYILTERILKISTENENIEIIGKLVGETVNITLNQKPTVSNLTNTSKEIYLKILISFLKADDGIIDDKEYRELCSVMANIKVDEETVDKLREYRYYGFKENTEYEHLIAELRESIMNNDKAEPKEILQSLASDIVNMHKEEVLNKWREYPHLVEVFEALGISEKQMETLILVREKQIKALTERLDNNSLNSLQQEIKSILGAAGLSYVGVSVLALFFATGLGTILGLGYASYKVVQKFFGLGNSEKYAIQNELLKAKMDSLSKMNAYIVADLNYLNNKNKELIIELDKNRQYDEELISELKGLLEISDVVSKSSLLVVEDQKHYNIEILLRKLPEKLDIDLYDKLVMDNVNYHEYNEIIYSVYELNQNSENGEYIIAEEKDIDLIEKSYNILKEIEYFNSSASALANANQITKEVVENIANIDGVKKGIGAFKSFLKK